MKEYNLATVTLSLRAKQPKRGTIAFDKGYIEIYEFPRVLEATITYSEDGSKKVFSDNYRLRMWVSDTTIIDDVSRTFQIKINVYGKVL